MGHSHFLTRGLKSVSTEMALHVLAYNIKRMISLIGIGGLMGQSRADQVARGTKFGIVMPPGNLRREIGRMVQKKRCGSNMRM